MVINHDIIPPLVFKSRHLDDFELGIIKLLNIHADPRL